MALIETVEPEKAEGGIEKVYSTFLQRAGIVPDPLKLMSVSPGILNVQGHVFNHYANHPNLGFALLTHIRYLVAREYNYNWCINFNKNLLKMQGMEDADIDKLVDQPESAPIEDKDKALLLFVLKALKTPEQVSREEMDALHEMGWTDNDIFDAAFHGAGMIAPSFLMKAFKMDTC